MTGLSVVSAGMVTAVGLSAPAACAAMRARLDGFQETRFMGPGGDWLIGAPVPLPRQWIGEKRLVHLAAGAVVDACDAAGVDDLSEVTLILCLAEKDRPGRIVTDASRFLRRLAEVLKTDPTRRSRVIEHGRPGGMVALEQARRMLRARESEFVLILGVDSYLTAAAIGHYLGDERLLTQNNPNGFIPGEAAAAIVCKLLTRKSEPGLHLLGVGLAREEAFIYNPDDLPLRGDGMTSAYNQALSQAEVDMASVGYRISDLIGEQYFFKQAALANIRLVRGAHGFQDLWSPGESLGNVGAAVVPIMVGMAHRASMNEYSGGDPVLIEASSDIGACGAAIFSQRIH